MHFWPTNRLLQRILSRLMAGRGATASYRTPTGKGRHARPVLSALGTCATSAQASGLRASENQGLRKLCQEQTNARDRKQCSGARSSGAHMALAWPFDVLHEEDRWSYYSTLGPAPWNESTTILVWNTCLFIQKSFEAENVSFFLFFWLTQHQYKSDCT